MLNSLKKLLIPLFLLFVFSQNGLAAITVVSHVSASNTSQTSGINTTGATIEFCITAGNSASSAKNSCSDSKSNTWTQFATTNVSDGSGGLTTVWVFDTTSPITATNQTFTQSESSGAIFAVAIKGTSASSPIDQSNTHTTATGSSSVSTGSITPTLANEIVFAFTAQGKSVSGYSINSGFSILESKNAVSGTNYGGTLSYILQTTATAENPTISWSSGTGEASAAIISVFSSGGRILNNAVINNANLN